MCSVKDWSFRLQGIRIYEEKAAERVRKSGWRVTPRNQSLLDTGPIHRLFRLNSDSTLHILRSDKIPALRWRHEHKVPPLTKK